MNASQAALVDDFDRNVSGGAFVLMGTVVSSNGAWTIPEDSNFTVHARPICDSRKDRRVVEYPTVSFDVPRSRLPNIMKSDARSSIQTLISLVSIVLTAHGRRMFRVGNVGSE